MENLKPDFPQALRDFLKTPRTLTAIARKMQWLRPNAKARLMLLQQHGMVVKLTARDLRESSKWKIAPDELQQVADAIGVPVDQILKLPTLHPAEEAAFRGLHPDTPFPHGISCRFCREERRCNYCGSIAGTLVKLLPSQWVWSQRCTSGRCPDCCRKACKHVTEG